MSGTRNLLNTRDSYRAMRVMERLADERVIEGKTYAEVAEEITKRLVAEGYEITVNANNVAGMARSLELDWNGKRAQAQGSPEPRITALESQVAELTAQNRALNDSLGVLMKRVTHLEGRVIASESGVAVIGPRSNQTDIVSLPGKTPGGG